MSLSQVCGKSVKASEQVLGDTFPVPVSGSRQVRSKPNLYLESAGLGRTVFQGPYFSNRGHIPWAMSANLNGPSTKGGTSETQKPWLPESRSHMLPSSTLEKLTLGLTSFFLWSCHRLRSEAHTHFSKFDSHIYTV